MIGGRCLPRGSVNHRFVTLIMGRPQALGRITRQAEMQARGVDYK